METVRNRHLLVNSTTSETNEGARGDLQSCTCATYGFYKKPIDLTTGNTDSSRVARFPQIYYLWRLIPTLEVYGGDESLMPSRMSLSLTSILSCTGVKWAWKALPPRPLTVAARPLEAVAATLGCGGG